MDPVTLVPAWRRNDAKIAHDATRFWHELRALPPQVSAEQRARDLCAAAYIGDELVGVSTIELRQSGLVRCRFAFFRCLVSPKYPDRRIAFKITLYSRQLLETWSKEHPAEKILGMATITDSPSFESLAQRPLWPAGLRLSGYTPDGRQIRLTWFDHARLDSASKPNSSSELPRNPQNAGMHGLTLVPAWQRNDSKLAGDARKFWQELRALPPGADLEQRVRELCTAAYIGDELVGVATIALEHSPMVRCRLGFFRCLVKPGYPGLIAFQLTHFSFRLLEQWSRENPQEKVLGMAAVLEAPSFKNLARWPKWQDIYLWLIGYMPDGRQVRLTWFDHARLD